MINQRFDRHRKSDQLANSNSVGERELKANNVFEPWTASGIFLVNSPSHYHNYIIKYLFTYREDKFENLGPVIQSQDSANPGLVHIIKQRILHDRLGIPISSSSAVSISHKLAKRTSKKEFSLDFMMFSYFLFQKVKNSNEEEKHSITSKAYLKKKPFCE